MPDSETQQLTIKLVVIHSHQFFFFFYWEKLFVLSTFSLIGLYGNIFSPPFSLKSAILCIEMVPALSAAQLDMWGFTVCSFYHRYILPLAGAATSIIFVATNNFVATKIKLVPAPANDNITPHPPLTWWRNAPFHKQFWAGGETCPSGSVQSLPISNSRRNSMVDRVNDPPNHTPRWFTPHLQWART